MEMNKQQITDWLKRVERISKQRGLRMTTQRRRVLEVILRAERALGAYEIMHRLSDYEATPAPPTVYRVLDFLVEQGLIHKIETLHAFIGCNHPEHPHNSQFLICGDCGGVTEIESPRIVSELSNAAQDWAFTLSRPIVEVLGTCATCRSQSTL